MMNELHLIDNFYLRKFDNLNFIIIEKTINKKGEKTEIKRGYYGSLQNALKRVLDQSILSDCEPLSAKTILDKIETLTEKINGLKCNHIKKITGGKKMNSS